ncbi:MAG: SDR family oxidoreductase [Acidimicrobiaceae bacterium]|nr:SDR family oxidoreductase [Acidimicrobiaceae bacterium]
MGMLDGRVVIVTGGAKGIGRAYCRALAEHGATVVVADMSDAAETVDEVVLLGGEAMQLRVDVSDVAQTEDMATKTVEAYGRIDGLVNNAGFFMEAARVLMEDVSPEEWDRCFAVNVKGTWLCSRAVTPTMKAQGSGKIVNISSTTVNDGTLRFLHYVSSKSAVVGLTRAMARELGPHGIAVNTITPDYIPHNEEYASARPEIDVAIRARRAFARTQVPEDVVGTLIYLMSPMSDFVTGQNIFVNGGSSFN